MVSRVGGQRRKTRQIMSKSKRTRGKISQRAYLQTFKTGDKVALKAEPGVQKGIYFRRFHGHVATVKRKVGTCYELTLSDQGKEKILLVHPVHLKKV